MQNEQKFERKGQKFLCRGVSLASPNDLQADGKFPILRNVVSYENGVVQQRPGTGLPLYNSAAGLKIHSIRRNNDYSTGDFIHVIGDGGNLSIGYPLTGTLTQIDTGYSGQPLSLIPFRPENAVSSWMYVADVLRMRKAGFYGGANHPIGVAPPKSAPIISQGAPLAEVIDITAFIGSWAQFGAAGAITSPQRVSVATTISAILYDVGATGWACIRFTNATSDFSFLGEGGRYIFNAAETAILQEAHRAVSSTIGSIIYDSGSTGLCTIQPATAIPGYQRNAMIQIAGAEYVRILSTTIGPDGQFSFRCVTTGTRSAGDTITGFPSYRFYLNGTFAAGNPVTGQATQSTITVIPPATSAQGAIFANLAAPFNLTTTGGRPVQKDDYMHISIKADNLASLTEVRVAFDVDSATTNIFNAADFTKNYFYKTFRANDFVAAAQQTLTNVNARQTAIQRELIDSTENTGQPETSPQDQTDPPENSTPASNQTGTGNAQWSELKFKISDLVRVGTDPSASLASVKAFRVSFTVTATAVVAFEGWWFGGTYGPDTPPPTDGLYYRYRYRSSETGAKSLPSPAQRSPEFVGRNSVIVGGLVTSSDAQVDKIDIERQGGINNEFHYIGTVPNGAGSFTDTLDSVAIKTNPALDTDAYQPFPVAGPYISGLCNVAGTSVNLVSGGPFNVNWARGVEINIAGNVYTLYAPPTSTSFLETTENIGSGFSLAWFIQDQLILGQPLPVIFGPFHGIIFGLGDINRPGTLLYTKGNDPDSAPENYNQEVTSPDEPLINGAVVDSRAYVFSNERMFGIYPDFDSPNVFRIDQIANSRGLFARWAICTGGGNIFFLGRDGIYRTGGEGFENITEIDLKNLFPHDGQVGMAVRGYQPPDMTRPDDLRLSFYDNYLQFAYVDTSGNHQVLTYNTIEKSWWPWNVALPNGSVQMFYGEEGRTATRLIAGGSLDGNVYAMTTGADDNGIPIACEVQPASLDQGDPRQQKKYGDLVLDADLQGTTLTGQLGFNFFEDTLPSVTRTNAARGFLSPFEINAGVGQLAHNISIDLTWSGNAKLYFWEPSYLVQPEFTQRRATDWMDADYDGAKFVQGVILTANTNGAGKSLLVQYDGDATGPGMSVVHPGECSKPYPEINSPEWVPFIAHRMRILGNDDVPWQYFGARWVYEPAPELVTRWITQETTHDLPGWQHVRYGFIPYVSESDGTFTIRVEDTDYTYALPNTNGLYRKLLIIFRPVKGKYFKYTISNTDGIRVFLKDLEVYVKAFGAPGEYQRQTPFGDLSRVSGARI